jgi:hypothetical protein
MKAIENVSYWRRPDLPGIEACQVRQNCHRFPRYGHDDIYAIGLMETGGAIFFSPGLYFMVANPPLVRTRSLVIAIVFWGGWFSLGAFVLNNGAMSRVPASRASIFINRVPVVAALIDWMSLGETLSLPRCAAALTVIGGVWFSQSAIRKAQLAACSTGRGPGYVGIYLPGKAAAYHP